MCELVVSTLRWMRHVGLCVLPVTFPNPPLMFPESNLGGSGCLSSVEPNDTPKLAFQW